ncbi:MAG: DM13 domain-containing protein [Planctomycetota bacterium]|nr:DM13 domain-containing protein [Planctomycetota bacterium]
MRIHVRLLSALLAFGALVTTASAQTYPRTGFVANLSTLGHNVSGQVHIVDANTIRVEHFFYDGGGISVYFYLGATNTNAAFASGMRIGPQLFGTPRVDATLVIDLPAGNTLNGFNAISVWCDAAGANFGSGSFAQVAPQSFCVGKMNSQGCTPTIATSGIASATSLAPLMISTTNVLNQSPGLMIYANSSANVPFQGGTLCIGSPLRRTSVMFSGGNTTGQSCTGSYALDFNAWVRSGIDTNLAAGREVFAQYYYRDAFSVGGVGLTNATRFFIGP